MFQRGSGSDAKSSAVLTRVRWVGTFVVLLLVCSAVPVFAAEQAEVQSPEPEKVEFTPRTSQEEEIAAAQVPTANDVYKALRESEAKEREREEWLASSEAIEQRKDSLLAFGDLSAGESEQLLRAVFEPQLEALNGDPSRFLSDAQLVKPVDDSAAVVKDKGDGSLMDSTLPVRTEDEHGELSKVDLTLEETPQGFKTDNALVDLALPTSAERAIEVGDEGFAIAQAGAAGSPARRFGDKNLFYPEVLPHTDLMVASTSFGAELFNLLRSKDSPEEFRFEIDVPEGAELRSDGLGGAEVVLDGETLTRIPKPWAFDAQQTDVPVTLEVEGKSIVLRVAHRKGDYARPILLDPAIIENGNNWYDGSNLALLTNGAWKWDSNNSNIVHDVCCWGGTKPGLLTNVWDAFYGPEQRGQWTYSTANGAVLVVHAWINPFLRVDNGCGSEEPHDYAGLWNPGDQWAPFLRDEAKKKQGAVTLAGWGQAAVIGMGTGAPGVWLACDRNLYAGGVALWLDDTWGPGITSAGVPSGSWFGDKAPTNISVSSWDEGLGVQYVKLLNEGKGVIAEERPNNCTGLYGSTCPNTHTSPFSGVTGKNKITGDSFGEGIRESSVTVSDPTGKVAEKFFTTKVDNSKPEVALGGQLAKATGEVVSYTEGEKPVGDGEDKLRLPVYNLEIKAKDGVWGTTNDKDKRSGVKDIEVWLEDKALEVPWKELEVPWSANSECPQTSCEKNVTYPLDLTEIDTAGSHKLKVIAKDFVGEEKVREIEFEYFPATGMKDEYVMHYFPLPNGQGNEAEEENPVRPELAVNVMNGNLVYRERDIDVDGAAGVDLEVERFYNSQLPDSENTEWGDGWTLAQTPDLEPVDTGGSPAPDEAELIDQSGALEEEVELPTDAGAEKFDPVLQATLEKKSTGGFELTDETGESATSVVFDATGQTEARLTEGAAKIDYAYVGGELAEIEVEDPSTFAADPEELQIPAPELISAPKYNASFGANGSGDGQFKFPTDVAVDLQGNLWVTDKSNNRIQKFDPSGKFIAKYGSLGSGDGQFNRPSSVAIDSAGNVLIADSNNHRIQKLSPEGAFISKFGTFGAGNGQLNKPEEVTADANGNIWVADTENGRVQKFNGAGEFLSVFDSGYLYVPTGVDVDSGGNVWVADWLKNRVTVFDSEGNFKSNVGTAGQFNRLDGLEIDNHGNVWVADLGNNRIQRLDLAGQLQGQFGTPGSGPGQFGLDFPMGIAADSKGHLWITDPYNDRVQQWLVPIDKPIYGSAFGTTGSGDGQFNFPTDIAIDLHGNLWVTDKSNNRIQKFDPSGKFIAKYGSLGSGNGQFNRPSSIAVDRDGNIVVADSNNHRIQKFNTAGEFISKFGTYGSGDGQLNKPEEVVADFEGNIWVADVLNGRAQKFDEEGQFLKVIDSGQLYEPMGIDVDAGGNVWVADRNKNRISVFDSEGNFKSHVGSAGSGNGQFNKPDAIEIDNKDNVWVADLLNNRVQRFDVAGQYVGQFGTAGSGPGQFGLDFPSGIATDREGRLWVTDPYNDRIQQWLIANYAPAEATQLDLTDGDAKVEVETPGGLVSSVSGNAAGEHDYDHEGELLVSHDGPDGETAYDYDAEDRLTKVTLPNGTWAEIDYEATVGRVQEVRVSIEGGAVKATKFKYTDQPARSTKVIPDGAPHVVYDIGDDGSVFKWWNTEKPPELDIHGALYDNREEDGFFWEGARVLEAEAESVEGIASIDIIANGDTLVDEVKCTEPEVIECTKKEIEWVTESDLHAPGHLQLEVIATDRNEKSTSERFWVDVPKPTPLAPGTPAQPRFRDIAEFREEYGLEVVFPVVSETELTERIFDLIKAWNEPNTPAGQVARASMDRWGVPLRPVDVAEMEYRERYVEINGKLIESWAETHHPGSYAGYFVDHHAGGIMRVGFTSQQGDRLGELKSQVPLEATERLASYQNTPTHSLQTLDQTQLTLSTAIEENAELASSVTEFSVEQDANTLRIGTDDVAGTTQILTGVLGAQAPVTIFHQPDKAELISGRFRTTGRMRAGDGIYNANRGLCTAGFGAYEDRLINPKSNNKTFRARFLLSAGHCYMLDEYVDRPSDAVGGKPWSEVGQVTRNAYLESHPLYPTDALAIRLKTDGLAPRDIYGSSGNAVPVEKPSIAGIGTTLCYSGAKSGRVSYGPVSAVTSTEVASGLPFGPPTKWIKGYRVKFKKLPIHSDSGSPVWNCRSRASVGLAVSIFPKFGYAVVAPLLPHPKLVTPGILNVPSMYDIQIITGS